MEKRNHLFCCKLVIVITVLCSLSGGLYTLASQENSGYFIIRVIDNESGRGIPMVEFRTTSQKLYITDSNGIIAFDDPLLLNQRVTFDIFSHGYDCPDDGLNLDAIPATSATVSLKRINIAERLYRITGQDIYGESVKSGIPFPIRNQGLNGKVTGQDTFIETKYKGKIYWFWGDTFGPAHFNGRASGATSELPGKGGLNPEVGIDLTYFTDPTGFSKAMCNIPGPGLVWIDWLVTIPDESGNERLYAKYSRTKTLDVDYERGIAVFNDTASEFVSVVKIDEWLDKVHSSGHPVRITIDSREYLYIFDRYGIERVRSDLDHITNPESYEHFTCLTEGNRYSRDNAKIDRGSDGRVIYSWKNNTDAISPKQQDELISIGRLSENEGWFRPVDITTGMNIQLYPASVFWNNFRKRWVMIAYEFAGGVWFLEGDTPTGPWVYARKIVAHEKYDFYNVGQHPLFDQEGGRLIYFEGTYTTGFSGNKSPTPLYDYNQMMYRLDLAVPDLSLPAPVYLISSGNKKEKYHLRNAIDSLNLWESISSIPFFALPAPVRNDRYIPVYVINSKNGTQLTTSAPEKKRGKLLFYALPPAKPLPAPGDLITGKWSCRAVMRNGAEEDFELILKGDGEIVSGNDVIKGSYRNDSLLLSMDFWEIYSLKAVMKDGMLNGTFSSEDGTDRGTWNGVRMKLKDPDEDNSSIVPLYEYKNGSNQVIYSIDPELHDPSFTRSGNPVCRVWRNPMPSLFLDYKAKAVPLTDSK